MVITLRMIPTNLFIIRLPQTATLKVVALLVIMKNLPIAPFCKIEDNKYIPNPRSVIQIAVSDYRNSDLSDRELAEHICENLSLLMISHNVIIERYDDTLNLIFRENQD